MFSSIQSKGITRKIKFFEAAEQNGDLEADGFVVVQSPHAKELARQYSFEPGSGMPILQSKTESLENSLKEAMEPVSENTTDSSEYNLARR